jgi:hypothetical protein
MLKIVPFFGLKMMFLTPKRAVSEKANYWLCTKLPSPLKQVLLAIQNLEDDNVS